MAAQPEIQDELRRLRARVPQLTGALATGANGGLLAQDIPGAEPRTVAALVAAAHGTAVRLADGTGQGTFRELLVRGADGHVATFAAGGTAVLTLLAEDRVNVGRLLLEGRRSAARVAHLLDTHATTTATPAPTTTPRAPAPAKPRSAKHAAAAPPTEPAPAPPAGPPAHSPPAPAPEPTPGPTADPADPADPRTGTTRPARTTNSTTTTTTHGTTNGTTTSAAHSNARTSNDS
ncbi:roadblock/LC7 domain-containing protein [Streptomyces sp. NPDC094437]|uniref:roadblock/LC7 domain-containing protein n=1 Tax=Streptomyces sp. NPDC094437 TaxID=3366060 RepID=UPI00381E95AE